MADEANLILRLRFYPSSARHRVRDENGSQGKHRVKAQIRKRAKNMKLVACTVGSIKGGSPISIGMVPIVCVSGPT